MRRDSLLSHPDSCPTDGVHLTGRAILLTVAFLYFLIDLIFSQSSDLYGGA